ncbi:hypothetical protein [Streptomyces sp. NPDC048332]|uniref:hypothetical protein n=1 Tax=unclassified Streptomyces TaxID=2593676 RepID=UPI00342F7D04
MATLCGRAAARHVLLREEALASTAARSFGFVWSALAGAVLRHTARGGAPE